MRSRTQSRRATLMQAEGCVALWPVRCPGRENSRCATQQVSIGRRFAEDSTLSHGRGQHMRARECQRY